MKTRFLYLIYFILGAIDLVIINLAFYFSFLLAGEGQGLPGNYESHLVVSNLLWFLSAGLNRLYAGRETGRLVFIYRATLRSYLLHMVFFVFYIVFFKQVDISRHFLVLFYVFIALGFLISRFGEVMTESVIRRYFNIRKPVAILGRNNMGLRLATYFEKMEDRVAFEGFLNEGNSLYVDENGKVLPSATEQIRVAASQGVKEVYVSLTPDRISEIGHLLKEAENQCVRLKFVPDFTGSLVAPFTLSYMGDFPVISLRKEPLEEIQNRFKKRVFDIVFSLLVIVFIFSWLFPIIAILIKLESRGPVLFKQYRSGRDNKPFLCYKFRSMRTGPEGDTKQASKGDSRITAVGSFLRKTSLDELPQFFNVLLGNMSVVGPRPHPLWLTEQYSSIINQYMVRHFLKAGITGWAQVNGFRGETKDSVLMERRVEHDIWYLENWSAMLDVKIIFMTIINMLKGDENAY
ncbi:putative colanic acid biosynthesis UDP-glucose lipid carrier transferase [Anseongella ginsenosidimutans]|uniref:Putative colanic acid biosynthesis UDP-glucose lipid carrier transferase n=1 Tax=Anseongella ginsenosidimutans TaxID=496056 RepID=A0A4R3KTA9_9SPHI|nr:undecaprenyl-phosphate glucose phosphotransferase [Anseongella ginsenosidimutans]QEC53353.1 undecaprenyl-phosphate glucose phosphotransferase [Anseongella ginsenosidimutans]TCS88237.1 putative colanic acid biosynthesis UDP-glucose lipid carrier transferase [Anseongella ginsenosidimutans]